VTYPSLPSSTYRTPGLRSLSGQHSLSDLTRVSPILASPTNQPALLVENLPYRRVTAYFSAPPYLPVRTKEISQIRPLFKDTYGRVLGEKGGGG
jgi:hypothetical protein